MMNRLHGHKVAGDTAPQVEIIVTDEKGQGGAHHKYIIACESNTGDDLVLAQINFQNGPMKEFGINGITAEALLEIIIHRLSCFQAGEYACVPNGVAMMHCKAAQEVLQSRTIDRIRRGVEGKNEK